MTVHQLLNTLYVQAQGAYLRLEHDTVVVDADGAKALQVPLQHLGGLALFGNVLVSPFLLHRCGEDGRAVAWYSRSGRFQGRLAGPTRGNVLLRCAQYEAHADAKRCLFLAQAFVEGKIRNARHVLLKGARDGSPGAAVLAGASVRLLALLEEVAEAGGLDALRGMEGNAAAAYFEAFPHLVLNDDPTFAFANRNRRPPRDPMNALLSFAYAMLTQECAAALEGVGLDPQVGYLHALRPGRQALALDLMEEFRPVLADRAVLTLVNRVQLTGQHFLTREGGAVNLNDDGRRIFLTHWQERKQEQVHHDLLDQDMPIGLLPHVQARLLARTVRGDIARYPAYAPR